MKAAILKSIKDIQIEDIEKPAIKDNEALVKVKAVGVCGSDVHYYLHGKIGNQIVKGPHILGHEAAGEVVEVGLGVKKVHPGMRVAIEPGIPCGQCEHCKSGRYNICPDVKFLGTPPISGAYREYMAFPEDLLFPIPDTMSFEEAQLIETLSVGMYAVDLADFQIGTSIMISGCGPIGLVILKAAVAAGAGKVFITDLIDERLEFAKKYDNVVTINASKENPVEKIMELTNGRGTDIVFEASGALDAIRQSIEIARIGGTIVWIGAPSEDFIAIDAHIARRKEIVIKMVRRFKGTYPRCIQQVASGNIVVKDMITHRFKLEDISKAFELVENYADGVMKAVIMM